jgi:hypothetical protein
MDFTEEDQRSIKAVGNAKLIPSIRDRNGTKSGYSVVNQYGHMISDINYNRKSKTFSCFCYGIPFSIYNLKEEAEKKLEMFNLYNDIINSEMILTVQAFTDVIEQEGNFDYKKFTLDFEAKEKEKLKESVKVIEKKYDILEKELLTSINKKAAPPKQLPVNY